MGRLLLIVLVNGLAWLVLRQLWPSVRAGRRQAGFIALVGLSVGGLLLPVVLGLGEHGVVPWVGMPLKLFSSVWFVAMGLLVLVGWPFAIARYRQLRSAPAGMDPVRRGFITQVGQALPVLAVGTSGAGVVAGFSGFEVRQVEVRLKGLPPALEGFRIGQITDVHVGAFIDTAYVRAAVAAMNEAGVDLQVMTGDLLDDLSQLEESMAALETCKAPHGMLAILGNHEHWRGLRPILAAYEASARRGSPVRLLVDEAHVLEHAGQAVRVVGVDYPMAGRGIGAKLERMQHSASVAFEGMVPGELVLCLSHHPDFFPLAAERGARLTLSGHTHGGQVAILGWPLFRFAFDYMLGRYRRGDHHLYVSGGTGHWLPFRLGVPAEVTVFTLRAAA